MIVDALYRHYETLLKDPESGVSRPGLSKSKVGHCLVLSRETLLLEIIDLRVERRNKLVSREIDVPAQQKRTSGVSANFMCDNCSYLLGLGQKDKGEERVRDCFQAFVQLHEKILGGVNDEGAEVLLKFLRSWDVAAAETHPVVARHRESLAEGSNLVFKLSGDEGYLHERKAVMDAWDRYSLSQTSDVEGQCLVTGSLSKVARLHQSIKGVTGAQSSGAALVSFNLDAFTSYGKTQSFNAPISEDAVFGYTTALNYLLSNEKHRVRIGDATTVFWAERSSNGLEEDLLSALLYPVITEEGEEGGEKKDDLTSRPVRDPQTIRLLQDILVRVRDGKPVAEGLAGVNKDTIFHILGLSPNASRLAVRFWHANRYEVFLEKIGQHYADMSIVKSYDKNPDFVSVGLILKETAPLKDSKRIAPLLGGVLMRAVLTGASYPMALYSALITRIRADRDVNYVRASVIKACLVRNRRFYKKESEVEFTVALNEQNRNTGYLLGRLFSLLEKAQSDANPGINSTIRDKYFGAASASPGSVFPILLRLAQHHLSKAEYGRFTDKRIEEIASLIDCFPAHLSLEEQGQFILGYYQQRQALYIKSDKKESAE